MTATAPKSVVIAVLVGAGSIAAVTSMNHSSSSTILYTELLWTINYLFGLAGITEIFLALFLMPRILEAPTGRGQVLSYLRLLIMGIALIQFIRTESIPILQNSDAARVSHLEQSVARVLVVLVYVGSYICGILTGLTVLGICFQFSFDSASSKSTSGYLRALLKFIILLGSFGVGVNTFLFFMSHMGSLQSFRYDENDFVLRVVCMVFLIVSIHIHETSLLETLQSYQKDTLPAAETLDRTEPNPTKTNINSENDSDENFTTSYPICYIC